MMSLPLLRTAFSALLCAASCVPNFALAAPAPCADRDGILERLASDHDEAVVARGLTDRGALIEITATANGESWTMIVTVPDGRTCLVAAGEAWQPVRVPRGEAM